jgi:hypothetical protein
MDNDWTTAVAAIRGVMDNGGEPLDNGGSGTTGD